MEEDISSAFFINSVNESERILCEIWNTFCEKCEEIEGMKCIIIEITGKIIKNDIIRKRYRD